MTLPPQRKDQAAFCEPCVGYIQTGAIKIHLSTVEKRSPSDHIVNSFGWLVSVLTDLHVRATVVAPGVSVYVCVRNYVCVCAIHRPAIGRLTPGVADPFRMRFVQFISSAFLPHIAVGAGAE